MRSCFISTSTTLDTISFQDGIWKTVLLSALFLDHLTLSRSAKTSYYIYKH